MFRSVLVVCVGNICRSPTGEMLLKQKLNGFKIDSAGLKAMISCPADEMAKEVAAQHNLSLDSHIAKQLTIELCKEHDLILVMEKKHIDLVCKLAPELRGKTMLFGHWLDQKEIADPYKKSREAFESVYQILDKSAQHWARVLIK
ncbi:TPA: protein tyrosine phosphatase [Raoultella ornithinolytica]|uniref:arsenate reductase/protein-tyrosine-phosphatase family protein n=1 Tax=Raoultella ornithinolytica TaxID=54291 RepID=UPI002DF42EAB|nr:protein tyrosine phosphatase [Raoultella ornithinolytica]MEC5111485.1 protein tyrosine phosphatase [Raoultella ornithinolytica]HCE8951677.1 protein tyrosine phosphatase [Raoultella ornithinolytica]